MQRLIVSALLWLVSPAALAAMQAKPVEWRVGDADYAGVLVYDDAAEEKLPGLVMVPNWMGVNDDAIAKAKAIAGNDYVILVADVYGKQVRPQNPQEASATVKAVFADGGAALRQRMQKAVDVLSVQGSEQVPLDPTRLAAFGFCFGGSAVLELARSGSRAVRGVVSLHGGLDSHRGIDGARIHPSVLVLNGADDTSVTDTHIAAFEKEMDDAGADWQFVNFGGAVHCFTQPESDNPPNCVYNERAAKRAMEMMDDFFDELFARDD